MHHPLQYRLTKPAVNAVMVHCTIMWAQPVSEHAGGGPGKDPLISDAALLGTLRSSRVAASLRVDEAPIGLHDDYRSAWGIKSDRLL